MEVAEVLERLNGRILIRFPNWIGDAVMASPVIEILHRRLPKAELFIAAPGHVCKLFLHHSPHVNLLPVPPVKGLRELLQNVSVFRKHRFDGAILLQNAFSASLATFLAGVPFRAGLGTDGRSLLLNFSISPARVKNRHQMDAFCFVASCLTGCVDSVSEINPRLFVKQDEISRVKEKFFIKNRYVLFHPGAAYGPAKRWLPDGFVALAKRIQKEYGFTVVIAGSKAEETLCSYISKQLASCRVVNVCGRIDIREMMGLQAGSELVVANDSGPMHTAAALGVKTVAIFGPTNPYKTSPKNQNCKIVYKKVECSPCNVRHCPTDHKCMKTIDCEDVFSAVSWFEKA